MPACPGATGCGYTTVFTAYECLTFHHRILTCQVWARGLGQGHNQKKDTHTLDFDVTLAWNTYSIDIRVTLPYYAFIQERILVKG